MAVTLEREDLKLALKGQHIHEFDRKSLRTLHNEINKRLEVFELTYGVRVRMGRYRFDGVTFRGKIEGSVLCDKNGVSADKSKWDAYCEYFHMNKSDYGKSITFPSGEKRIGGKTGTLCGINTKSKKYPVLVKVGDKVYRCAAAYTIKLLTEKK